MDCIYKLIISQIRVKINLELVVEKAIAIASSNRTANRTCTPFPFFVGRDPFSKFS